MEDQNVQLDRKFSEKKKTESALQSSLIRLEKSRSAELNLLEDLRDEIAQRREAEEKVLTHLAEQQLISEVARKLVSITSTEEVYKYIGECIYRIAGDAFVYVASLDTVNNTANVKHLFGFGKALEKLIRTLNFDVLKISVSLNNLDQKVKAIYESKEVVYLPSDGIYILTAGTLNKSLCTAVEKVLGIKSMNVMGFNSNDRFFGGVGIVNKGDNVFKRQKLFENLVNQASVALQKLFAEEKLRQEHDNLNAILSCSPVSMLVIDQNERIVRHNPAACKLFNRDFSDINDSHCGDFLGCVNHKENVLGCGFSSKCDNCIVLSSIRLSLTGNKKVIDQEAKIVRRTENGIHTMWVRFSIEPLVFNGLHHIIIALHDTTVSKLAEEELHRKERHFRALIERAPDGVVLISSEGKFKYVSPAALKIFGYTEGIHMPSSPVQSTHPDDLPLVLGVLSELIVNPGYLPVIEYRFLHADNSWRWIESSFSNLLSEPGVEAIVINFRDITDRKEAELALEYSEKRFRALLENSTDAIVLTDPQGIILYESPGYEHISGWSAAERFGKSGFEFVHPGDKPAIEQMLKEVLDDKESVHTITIRSQHKDGSWHWLECSITNLLTEPAIKGIAVNIHDITRQTRDREAMRMSAAKYRGLFEANKDGISIFYANEDNTLSNFAEVNEAAASMLGYTKKEMLNLSVLDLEINTDFEILNSRKKEIREKGFSSTETIIRHKNGAHISVELLVVPLQYNDRIALMNIVRDITKRKHTEEALHRSEQKYRLMADNISDVIWSMDNQMKYTFISPSIFQLRGLSQEEAMQESFEDSMTPESLRIVNENIIKSRKEELLGIPPKTVTVEVQQKHKNGSLIWAEIAVHTISGSSGERIGLMGVSRDVTKRKEAEDALIESRQELLNIIDFLPDATFVVDNEKKVIAWNKAMEEMTGIQKQDMIGKGNNACAIPFYGKKQKQLLDMIDSDDEVLMNKYSNVSRNGLALRAEVFAPALYHGKGAYVSEICSPLYNSSGDRVGSIESIRDISESKKAQEEIYLLNTELEQRVTQRTLALENTNKELEAFSYSVSHDLRAPLRGIDGWSLALLEDYNHQLDDKGRVYIARVRSESQRMGNLIDDLLKLSRVNRYEMRKVNMNISAIVQSIADRSLETYAERGFNFIIPPGISAYGDPQMLEIVLTNLFENACKFTVKKSVATIEFGSFMTDGLQTYFVRDNGVGFDMEYAKKLFGAFQRMHKQSEFPGSGIGLATVKRIISRHGGRVWAESKPGEGATFYFTSTYNNEK